MPSSRRTGRKHFILSFTISARSRLSGRRRTRVELHHRCSHCCALGRLVRRALASGHPSDIASSAIQQCRFPQRGPNVGTFLPRRQRGLLAMGHPLLPVSLLSNIHGPQIGTRRCVAAQPPFLACQSISEISLLRGCQRQSAADEDGGANEKPTSTHRFPASRQFCGHHPRYHDRNVQSRRRVSATICPQTAPRHSLLRIRFDARHDLGQQVHPSPFLRVSHTRGPPVFRPV